MRAALSPRVMLHGWGTSARLWEGFDAAAVDLPGHGARPEAPRDFDAAVGRLAGELPPRAHLCGWSLGALFALAIAARFPQRVGSLVLVGATPRFVAGGGWAFGMGAADFEAFERGMRQAPASTRSGFVTLCGVGGAGSRQAIRDLEERVAQAPLPHPHALAWLREADLRGAAAAVVAPALLVHGARDRVAPIEAARWLARAMPDARLVEIADAAHLPFLSHRAHFVREVEAFLG